MIQRANEMILNKSTITLSDDDKIFLIQGLNFAPTPSWNSKTETTEWLNSQSHIHKVEWNNVLSIENNENKNQEWHNLLTKLKVPKMSRPNLDLVDDKTKAYCEAVTSKLRNLKPLVEFSFKYRNNMSQDLRTSFKYLKKLVKNRKIVICRADKDGKRLVLDFKDYNLIMEREFANQFQELTHVDLTSVHHELQQIKDKCDNFLKNLHKAGAIDDSMLFHVTGLKEREQKYHKCSGNSAKYFSDLATMGRHLFTAHYTCFRTTVMNKSNAFL